MSHLKQNKCWRLYVITWLSMAEELGYILYYYFRYLLYTVRTSLTHYWPHYVWRNV